MNVPKSEIIPFGKYKGQTIDSLQSDPQYLDWLVAQDWFRNRYKNIYSIVINNFNNEHVDTPEHNRLHVKFLDDDFIKRFLFLGDLVTTDAPSLYRTCSYGDGREYCTILNGRFDWYPLNEIKSDRMINLSEEECIFSNPRIDVTDTHFEYYGQDVHLVVERSFDLVVPALNRALVWEDKFSFSIEIKPVVSDDFPSVLRQIKSHEEKIHAMLMRGHSYIGHGTSVLFLEKYTGEGATKDQFVSFFNSQGIKVIFYSDIIGK